MRKPLVALVGRTNVGKSTLFNRLVGGRTAIVADEPGVTRDRIYRDVEWDNSVFTLIDTGGLFLDDPEFREQVYEQVDRALDEADLIVLVVDGKAGLTSEDEKIARVLRKTKKR